MWCQKLEESKCLFFSLSKAPKHATCGLLSWYIFTRRPLPSPFFLPFWNVDHQMLLATCADLGNWRSANGLGSELPLYFTVRPLNKALPSVPNDLFQRPHRTTSPAAAAAAVTLYFFSLLTPRLKFASPLSVISAAGNLPTTATSI